MRLWFALIVSVAVVPIIGCDDDDSPVSTGGQTDEEVTIYLRDYEYAEGRIFDLFYPDETFGPYDSLANLVVYEESAVYNPEAVEIVLLVDPTSGSTVGRKVLWMAPVDRTEYEIWYGQDSLRSRVIVMFHSSQYRALGVYMEIERYDAQGVLLGTDVIGAPGDTAKFLQEQPNDQLPTHPTWGLVWRNCYRIPPNTLPSEIDVKVFKGLPGFEGSSASSEFQTVNGVQQESYLQILGLDQWDNAQPNIKVPDNKFDARDEVFRPEMGLMILPHREPFNSNTTFTNQNGVVTHPLAVTVPNIYDYFSEREKSDNSVYYLQISVRVPN
jgi:hypothetical protein